MEKTYRRISNQENDDEPELAYLRSYQVTKEVNIFPCEDGEIFDCQESKSNETLDENCGKILIFNSETSSCSCRGSNRQKRNSEIILRQGWSQYIR